LSEEGLPIGLQFVGPHWSEGRLLNLASAYERAHPFMAMPRVRVTKLGE
jgi:Asp-tRNA(Asn)/Glu-tRNA(Gln) amidotransferase A subunit family amidase